MEHQGSSSVTARSDRSDSGSPASRRTLARAGQRRVHLRQHRLSRQRSQRRCTGRASPQLVRPPLGRPAPRRLGGSCAAAIVCGLAGLRDAQARRERAHGPSQRMLRRVRSRADPRGGGGGAGSVPHVGLGRRGMLHRGLPLSSAAPEDRVAVAQAEGGEHVEAAGRVLGAGQAEAAPTGGPPRRLRAGRARRLGKGGCAARRRLDRACRTGTWRPPRRRRGWSSSTPCSLIFCTRAPGVFVVDAGPGRRGGGTRGAGARTALGAAIRLGEAAPDWGAKTVRRATRRRLRLRRRVRHGACASPLGSTRRQGCVLHKRPEDIFQIRIFSFCMQDTREQSFCMQDSAL